MGKKINDEFSHLPAREAFDLRHPGRSKEYLRKHHRTTKFLDRHRDYQKKVRDQLKHSKLLDKAKDRANHRIPTSLQNEVKRHLSKGRSVADIVIWMEIPESKVREIIASLEKPVDTPAAPCDKKASAE